MKKLLRYADAYIRQSDWKDLAMIKFCLCAAGVMIGLALPARARKMAGFAAMAVFAATYPPLVTKLLRIAGEEDAG